MLPWVGAALSFQGPAGWRGATELWICPCWVSPILGKAHLQGIRHRYPGSGQGTGQGWGTPAALPARTRQRRLQGLRRYSCSRGLGGRGAVPPSSRSLHVPQLEHEHAHALCTRVYTHSSRIKFAEKTNVMSTVKLYLKYKFCAYLPASLFFHIPTSIHLSTTVSNFTFQTLILRLSEACIFWPARLILAETMFSYRELISLLRPQALCCPRHAAPCYPLSPRFSSPSSLSSFHSKSPSLGPSGGAYLSAARWEGLLWRFKNYLGHGSDLSYKVNERIT